MEAKKTLERTAHLAGDFRVFVGRPGWAAAHLQRWAPGANGLVGFVALPPADTMFRL